jgi:hypothetical protein
VLKGEATREWDQTQEQGEGLGLIAIRRQVPCQIHRIVKDTHDFDHMILRRSVHDEMSSASAKSRDMKGSEVGTNIFAPDASRNVGAGIERGERVE